MNGKIFDIQRFSLHDGPGIRTTVFMKGCPLSCPWCHNPEGLSTSPAVQFFEAECIGCGACEGEHTEERAHLCPTGAIKRCVREISAEELLSELMRDKDFYRDGGGITFSGGECLLQADFLVEVMTLLKEEGINIAVDTSGEVPYAAIEKTLPFTEHYLYDVKCIDSELHKSVIGKDNRRILENLARLSGERKKIHIRVPVIPDFNDSDSEQERIAAYLAKIGGITEATLLPYHTLGKSKYATLGLAVRYDTEKKIGKSRLDILKEIYRNYGLNAN